MKPLPHIIGLVVLFVFNINITLGQEFPQPDIDLERFVEEVFSLQDQDISYEDLYESLLLLYSSPINLNNTSKDELRSIYLLSELQINHLESHIKKHGKLLSIYELQAIKGFDLSTIYKLLPFVTVRETSIGDNRPLWLKIKEEQNNYLLLRYSRTLEDRKGYLLPEGENRYLGSPDKLYARFRVSHPKDFSLGFTLEKDAGEQLIWDGQTRRYGVDFYSFHFQLQQRGRLKNLILGDYQVQLGQGLLLSAGFNVGKGAETVNTVRRSHLGCRPFTSVLESGYFRGVTATVALTSQIETTVFLSRLKNDANIQAPDTVDSFDEFITSLQTSGLHRTEIEIGNKKGVTEQVAGSNLLYTSRDKSLQLGANFVYSQYSLPLFKRDFLYNKFEFQGSKNHNIGFHYSYNWQNFILFGEAARSQSGGIGFLAGFAASLSPQLEMAVLHRRYDKKFHTLYGAAFGEGTRNINEAGTYWGMKFTPSRHVFFTAYYDRFSFPWLKFRVNAPSNGQEYLLRANYHVRKGVSFFVQAREEEKEINPSGQNLVIDVPMKRRKRNYAINFSYPTTKNISFKTRIQFSNVKLAGVYSKGYALAQDLNIELGKFKVSSRFALFDNDDFENRQYIYERDVLYAFSIPAYNGIGSRSYVLLQYNASRKLNFWLKYARTRYIDRETVSSGLNEIDGNRQSDIKFQTRVKF